MITTLLFRRILDTDKQPNTQIKENRVNKQHTVTVIVGDFNFSTRLATYIWLHFVALKVLLYGKINITDQCTIILSEQKINQQTKI